MNKPTATPSSALVFLLGVFLFASPFVSWWSSLSLPWYAIFLPWALLITLCAASSRREP